MKKLLTALVLASFLGAGMAYAQGTDAAAPAVKPEPAKKAMVHKHHKHHKLHKKAAAKAEEKAAPAPENVPAK